MQQLDFDRKENLGTIWLTTSLCVWYFLLSCPFSLSWEFCHSMLCVSDYFDSSFSVYIVEKWISCETYNHCSDTYQKHWTYAVEFPHEFYMFLIPFKLSGFTCFIHHGSCSCSDQCACKFLRHRFNKFFHRNTMAKEYYSLRSKFPCENYTCSSLN